MPYISIEIGQLTAEQKQQLIERLTVAASEILCKALRVFPYSGAVTTSRRHHEIYLSDPRKCSPEKMKTVLRIPVAKRK